MFSGMIKFIQTALILFLILGILLVTAMSLYILNDYLQITANFTNNFTKFIMPLTSGWFQYNSNSTNSSFPVIKITPSRTPFQPLPTSTATLTPTVTNTQTMTLTTTPTPTPTFTSTFTSSPTYVGIPNQAQITGITGYPQLYNLDCEARSAVDFAAYYGFVIDVHDFLSRLPLSDDPEQGFVGNFYDPKGQIPPSSYGVHAGPIANLLNEYGLNTTAHKDFRWDAVMAEIAAGKPVIAWVINNTYPGVPIEYITPGGNSVVVAHYEHTVIVIGYDPYNVTILDGDSIYTRTIRQFLESWSVLGNMVIIHN